MKLSKRQMQELAVKATVLLIGIASLVTIIVLEDKTIKRKEKERKEKIMQNYAPSLENADSLELIK